MPTSEASTQSSELTESCLSDVLAVHSMALQSGQSNKPPARAQKLFPIFTLASTAGANGAKKQPMTASLSVPHSESGAAARGGEQRAPMTARPLTASALQTPHHIANGASTIIEKAVSSVASFPRARHAADRASARLATKAPSPATGSESEVQRSSLVQTSQSTQPTQPRLNDVALMNTSTAHQVPGRVATLATATVTISKPLYQAHASPPLSEIVDYSPPFTARAAAPFCPPCPPSPLDDPSTIHSLEPSNASASTSSLPAGSTVNNVTVSRKQCARPSSINTVHVSHLTSGRLEMKPDTAATGTRNKPIEINASPVKEQKTCHPMFAPRRKASTNAAQVTSITAMGTPVPMKTAPDRSAAPWPSAAQQHAKAEQGIYGTTGVPSRCSRTKLSRQAHPQSDGSIAWLRNSWNVEYDRNLQLSSNLSPQTPHSAWHDLLSCLPASHIAHPAISRLKCSVATAPLAELTWNDEWRPKRAVEVLGNEHNALYLKAWLEALELQMNHNNHDQHGEGEPRCGPRPKRPAVMRAANERIKRRRLHSDSESDWVVSDGDDGEEPSSCVDDGGLADIEKLPVHRPLQTELLARPQPLRDNVERPDYPDFSKRLANTILLVGPPGAGKTATAYACAQELGWEVFELYPGVGKRSGANVMSLVGDAASNHVMRVVGPRNPLQAFAKPRNEPQADTGAQEEESAAFRGSLTMNQSLLLFDEADILFKDDVGFWPTMVNLIKNSRRPVLLTCNDASLVPLLDLPLQAILTFEPCPRSLATSYLQCLALTNGHVVDRPTASALYEDHRQPFGNNLPASTLGAFPTALIPDLRRAINDLQVHCSKSESTVSEPPLNATSEAHYSHTAADTEPCLVTRGHGLIEVMAEWHVRMHPQSSQTMPTDSIASQLNDGAADLRHLWNLSEAISEWNVNAEHFVAWIISDQSPDTSDSDQEIGQHFVGGADDPESPMRTGDVSRTMLMQSDALYFARRRFEATGAGRRARETARDGYHAIDLQQLDGRRKCHQSFLNAVTLLLPRPFGRHELLDYAATVSAMVAVDARLARAAAAAEEAEGGLVRVRKRTRRGAGVYERYMPLSGSAEAGWMERIQVLLGHVER